MTNEQLERLALLAEECAEVQQIAMKIIRHGYQSYNPFDEGQTPNRRLLEKELGHLEFALRLMIDEGDLSGANIAGSRDLKRDTIRPYLHYNLQDWPKTN